MVIVMVVVGKTWGQGRARVLVTSESERVFKYNCTSGPLSGPTRPEGQPGCLIVWFWLLHRCKIMPFPAERHGFSKSEGMIIS